MRGATSRSSPARLLLRTFQSTLLMRGATRCACASACGRSNFNPRSSCEERQMCALFARLFISNFNPRSSCEERHGGWVLFIVPIGISIHAPHARSDLIKSYKPNVSVQISIHAPHARSDMTGQDRGKTYIGFQSTLLMRGATQNTQHTTVLLVYFNPRSSCEERRHYLPWT